MAGRDNKEKAPPTEPVKVKGSITIYLMLVIMIVLVLVCTLVESGRVSALSFRLKSLTYMGMDSVFSEYADSVFEDYGITLLWMSEDEFISEFSEYAGYNLDPSDLSYSADAFLYPASLSSASIESVSYITDDSGLIFAQQVYEYMEYYLAESAACELLESLDIFSQSTLVRDFMETIESFSDVFVKVESSVSAIKDLITQIQDLTQDPSELLQKLYETASSFSEENAVYSEFTQTLTELKNAASELKSALEDIEAESEEYYSRVSEAESAADELEQILNDEALSLDGEIYEILKEQLDELEEKSADTDADYYEVGINNETADALIKKLESLDGLYDALSDGLSSENAAEYAQVIAQYQEIFSDFDLSELGVNYDLNEVESEDSSILDAISDFLEGGVLAYVMDDISENTIETDELPSVTVNEDDDTDESLAEAALNKIVFCQYVLEHFSNAVDTYEDTALEYEVEYILGGKASDTANMSVVAGELIALRSGLNFISILKDSEKKEQAASLATAMVGFTGLPVLEKVFELLIMTAWSAAEAVTDVKSLLAGEKVPAIKSSDEWNLSIEGFKNFAAADIDTASYDTGLEYEDYLRVLLAMQSDTTGYYRAMDLIQANMCLNENEDFKMSECIVSVCLDCEYEADEIFTGYSWVKSEISGAGGGYLIGVSESFEY